MTMVSCIWSLKICLHAVNSHDEQVAALHPWAVKSALHPWAVKRSKVCATSKTLFSVQWLASWQNFAILLWPIQRSNLVCVFASPYLHLLLRWSLASCYAPRWQLDSKAADFKLASQLLMSSLEMNQVLMTLEQWGCRAMLGGSSQGLWIPVIIGQSGSQYHTTSFALAQIGIEHGPANPSYMSTLFWHFTKFLHLEE